MPNAAGPSEYDQERSSRELGVWLADVGGLPGHHVAVYLNGHKVGTMTVSGIGRGLREWDTEHGPGQDSVLVACGLRI